MIDEMIERYGLDPNKFYPSSTLYDILFELGLVRVAKKNFTTNWINRKVEKGVLVLPKKQGFSKWYFTGKQIEGMLKAFIPGGKGYYNYLEDERGTSTTQEE